MKHVRASRLLSFLTALVLVVSLFSGLSLTAFADTLLGTPTGYTAASQVVYSTEGSYVKNWGARGEDCVFLTTYAQNYYTGSYAYNTLSANAGSSNASSYTSSALYNALHSMMAAKHTHETTYNETRDLYCYTDCVNNNSSYISSFYSGTRVSGTWDSGSTWNREHTWPQSKTTSDSSQLNDIMMLRPTATSENSSRSNKAYGVSDGYFDPNSYVGSTGLNLRGDCARIMLYCYVRWSENAGNMWGSDGAIESLDLLLDWIAADPVDTWEMARNDAVQSITGVRNCFVDYPELAFQLFGRTAPSDMTTPSGGAAVTYTVSAVSNNTNYGTVSVNGYTITASPKTGYYAAGYTVTSGSAAVAQNGNVFTVTPSSNCTVRINFAAKTPVTVTYMANGSVWSTANGYAGEALTLPAAAAAVSDWTAVGWSTGTVAFTNEKPEYYELGASYTPTANVTLYAVYAQSSGSGVSSDDYALFTGALEEGSYLVTYNGYVMKGSLTSANRLDYTTLTASNDVITTSDASLVWELSAETVSGTTYWRFCNAAAGTYAAATSTNNRAALLSSVNDYARWSVTESGGTYDFQNKSTGRYLRSNGTYGFAAYSSTTGGPLSLYKNVQTGTTYTTNPSGEDYTVTFTTPAGVTAPAPMTINSLTGATLPTAGAPEGYTFLGWVTEDYDNVTVMPDPILTGLYKPTADVTLKALYSYEDSSPSLVLMTVNDTLSEGDRIVITAAGTNFGLYRQSHSWNHVKNFEFTNDAEAILADPKMYFPVTQADIGWYLGDNDNGWLYTPANTTNLSIKADNSNFMASFALTTYEDHLVLMDTIDYNPSVFYLSCRTNLSGTNQNQWAMVNADSISGIVTLDIYKLNEGVAVTYYTTLIGEEHVHTPGSPVTENNVPATCTNPGSYDTVVYCTDCGEELSRETVTVPALGHDYQAAVTEPTCTEPGYTTYTCSRCGGSYVGDQTAALGHLAGAPVQENYVAPTVTAEGGYDMVTYCQRCGVELSREHTVLPATGPVEPIETSNLHVYSSISVGTDMVITFTVRKNDLTDYNNFWLEVIKKNPDGDVTFLFNPDQMIEGTSTWTLKFTNIFAKEMGIDVEARLYAENAAGQIYRSPARNANIRDYLAGRLLATNNSVEQRVLAADMLNYGAAAQRFTEFQTDHLVNEEISNEAQTKLRQYETTTLPTVNKTNYNTRPDGQSNILFTSVTLGNEVLLNLTIRLPEETEGVQVLVKDHATGAVVTTLDTFFLGSTFTATFNGIGADKMRTEYDLVTFVDGVQTGNIRTWSVEAYVGEIRTEGIPLKVAMGNALLTYGDSAAAYFAAQ